MTDENETGNKVASAVGPDGHKVQFITNDAFIKDRPWICCRDPLVLGRDKDTAMPLVAMCDKKAGHGGKHRGRFDGNTYIWRTRSKVEVQNEMRRRVAETERHNRVEATKAGDPSNADGVE